MRVWLTFAGVLLLLLFVAGPGFASRDTYTETVEPGYHWAQELAIWEDGLARLQATVRVLGGAPVNVFLLDEPAYTRYLEGETFSYYRGIHHLSVRQAELTHQFVARGQYFIVVDNVDHETGALPTIGSQLSITTIFPYDVLMGQWQQTSTLGSVVAGRA